MIKLSGAKLGLKEVKRVVYQGEEVSLSGEVLAKLKASRAKVEESWKKGKPIYGVNTGVGALSELKLSRAESLKLQKKLILSHSAGVGELLPLQVVRGMLLFRAVSLAKGYSGVRPLIVERLLLFLNRGLLPRVPSRGSVGASGDLAPLAHLAQALLAKGEVVYQGKIMSAAKAHRLMGISPLELFPKEGLALINGTQAMTALLSLALIDLESLLLVADAVAALSFYVLRANPESFSPLLFTARPHRGAGETGENLSRFLKGSTYKNTHFQDAYSLRCIPQVHGGVKDLYRWARELLEIEINSATDNPLISPEDGRVIRGGNFHGSPLALTADCLAIGLCHLAGISERRLEKILNSAYSGFPAFLAKTPGLDSGFMLCQYTAAALVSENKTLAHPASVDSIPTSAGQEDYANMGNWAALKAGKILHNLEYILAIEWLAGAQALEYLDKNQLPAGVKLLYRFLRTEIKPLKEDRSLSADIEKTALLLYNPELLLSLSQIVKKELL